MFENKEKYSEFCEKVYVPIYSKPWYMDTVCGKDNWDVWLYEENGNMLAAMPYYLEKRGDYKYITKAPLAQNNGIIFNYSENLKPSSKQKFEETVIDAAVEFINSLNLDVYEQQYMPSFKNYLPFFWNRFTIIPRITYTIKNQSKETVFSNLKSKMKNEVKKGNMAISKIDEISYDEFCILYDGVYEKQGRPCPFTHEFMINYMNVCDKNNSGKMFCAFDENDDIVAFNYLIFDEKCAYYILGGVNIHSKTKAPINEALVYHIISYAMDNGYDFDFEGSVIKNINHFFRKFEGEQTEYFRIRKVFNPEIVIEEAKNAIC